MRRRTTYFILTLLITLGVRRECGAQLGHAETDIIYSTDEINAFSDTTALFTIRQIVIEGNRKTQDKVILRELSFEQDEQYPLHELIRKFGQAKKQLMNRGLFHDVVVALKNLNGYDVSVLVTVRERWYIYPVPFVKVVDRSFQEWVKNQNMDLNRVNYGIKVTHKNLTGLGDRLIADFTNGYTKEVEFRYEGFPLGPDLKWFAGVGVAYGKNREINYATIDNQQVSFKNPDGYVRSYFRTNGEVSYRPAIKTKHTVGFQYTNESITDTVFKLNSHFNYQTRKISFPEVFYRMDYYDVDFIPYPTRGFAGQFALQKKGFNGAINMWQVIARTSTSWKLSDKYFFNLRATGQVKLPFKQPYIMQYFIGHQGMFLQGYEDYIIDGVAGGFSKVSLHRQLLNTAVHIRSQKIKRLNNMPIRIYGKVFGNAGYIYNEEAISQLNNRMLYSGGVGIDIVFLYDFIFRIEWSVNHLKQNGLYLHDRSYL